MQEAQVLDTNGPAILYFITSFETYFKKEYHTYLYVSN